MGISSSRGSMVSACVSEFPPFAIVSSIANAMVGNALKGSTNAPYISLPMLSAISVLCLELIFSFYPGTYDSTGGSSSG